MTNPDLQLSSDERPPARSRGARVMSRILAVVGIAAVGGFGYLLGVRLNSASTSTTQSGFGGAPGAGAASGGQSGSSRSGQSAGSADSRAGASGSSAAGPRSGAAGQAGSGAASRTGSATSVETTAAGTGQLSTQRDAAGTVVPLLQSNVPAGVAGTVQSVLQPVGASVKKGQAVAVLSSDTLQAAVQTAQTNLQKARVDLATQTNANLDQRTQLSLQVSSAQAALATAQQTLAANQRIYAIGGIAQTELSTSRSAVDTARAALASATASLAANERAKTETLAGLQLSVQDAQDSLAVAQRSAANATVRAPFDGQISAVAVSPGENVAGGATVFTLVGAGRKVTFGVAPADAGALKAGQVLPFKVNQQTYQVKLDQNPAAPVNSVVTVSARLLGTDLPDSGLPDTGAVGTVSYSVPVASGTLVPTSAVQTDGSQAYVFVYRGGKAARQNVTVLGQSGDQSAVSGLNAGSSVLSSPPAGLLDGASVTVAAAGTSSAGNAPQGGPGGPP